jgi:hypothetical protein
MSAYDSTTNQKVSVAIGPTDGAAIQVGPTVGAIIDTRAFGSLDFVIQSGTITTGDFTAVLEEGDEANLSDATVVSAEETIGALPQFLVGEDDVAKHVGSIGKKRYQRLSLLGADTPLGDMSAVAVQGHARDEPTTHGN